VVDEGAVFSAVAVVFFFICGVLVNCTPRPEPVVRNNKDIEISSNKDSDNASVPSTLTIKTKPSAEIDDDASHKNIV
jgi:hypothetical protein